VGRNELYALTGDEEDDERDDGAPMFYFAGIEILCT
jgi:hypothetical protein